MSPKPAMHVRVEALEQKVTHMEEKIQKSLGEMKESMMTELLKIIGLRSADINPTPPIPSPPISSPFDRTQTPFDCNQNPGALVSRYAVTRGGSGERGVDYGPTMKGNYGPIHGFQLGREVLGSGSTSGIQGTTKPMSPKLGQNPQLIAPVRMIAEDREHPDRNQGIKHLPYAELMDRRNISEDVKVRLAKLSMEGATIHYFNLLKETEDLTWVKLKKSLIERYGGRQSLNQFEELLNLNQSSTVEEYVTEFEYISSQLLVDWTRGKNLIFSSAAPSVIEIRGPYDVANLECQLGFSVKRAKAVVSKTCRSLLENALRKKKFYKEAIRVELISSVEQTIIDVGFNDGFEWDPISGGEGDLQLDDMAKAFAASSKESKTVKSIDFVSIIDGLPSHGLHIKDMISETKSEPYGSYKGSSAAIKIGKPPVAYDVPIDSKMCDPPDIVHTSVMETLDKSHLINFGHCDISADETLEALGSAEGGETCAMIIEEETKMPSNSNICFSPPEVEL